MIIWLNGKKLTHEFWIIVAHRYCLSFLGMHMQCNANSWPTRAEFTAAMLFILQNKHRLRVSYTKRDLINFVLHYDKRHRAMLWFMEVIICTLKYAMNRIVMGIITNPGEDWYQSTLIKGISSVFPRLFAYWTMIIGIWHPSVALKIAGQRQEF